MGNEDVLQLQLPIALRDDATLDNFVPVGSSGNAVGVALRDLLNSEACHPLYLSGPAGSGRSHLLQAACHLADQQGLRAGYLPLTLGGPGVSPDWLGGQENFDLLAIDDLQSVVGLANWEESLLYLYNRCSEAGCRLLLAASEIPGNLGCQLADLESRLASCLLLRLEPAGDEDKAHILTVRAAARGLQLAPDVARYILNRAPRGMASLIALLERLDSASLAAGRRLTIPFVRDVMKW